jgi:DNA anti-recombination protein RmuC
VRLETAFASAILKLRSLAVADNHTLHALCPSPCVCMTMNVVLQFVQETRRLSQGVASSRGKFEEHEQQLNKVSQQLDDVTRARDANVQDMHQRTGQLQEALQGAAAEHSDGQPWSQQAA